MKTKISINKIIKEHYNTYKVKDEDGDERWSKRDFLIFLGLPIVLSCLLVYYSGNITADISEPLLLSLSIFTPILFSLLPIIYGFFEKPLGNRGYELINQFKANVLFVILISIFSLFLLLLFSLGLSFDGILFINSWNVSFEEIYLKSLSFLIYFLLGSIVLHILMILQRFNFLMNEFIKLQKNKKDN